MLPVDLRLGKVGILNMDETSFYNVSQMLVLGTVFQCLNPILTVVGCLSSKPIFANPMNKRDEATQ